LVAQNVARQIEGKDPLPFRYRDPGTMVTIGRNAAVAHIGGRSLTGFLAWVVWLSVHLLKLIGFRNRLLVLINWAWDYFFYERAVRLILPVESSLSSRLSGCDISNGAFVQDKADRGNNPQVGTKSGSQNKTDL
ncbi:MAG: hypothetical protein ABI623_10395, partial [bacterium]